MKAQTFWSKILDWIFTPHYDCSKGKHRWVYKLSESGKVYLDESKVPKELWFCADCGIKRF